MANSGFQLSGVIHLCPLPGAPVPAMDFSEVARRALKDAQTLVDGGITSCVIENIGDAPFSAGSVDPHVIAMMTRIGAQIRDRFGSSLKIGVNVLRNDARGALAVAKACGAEFVRVNVHTGSAWTDQGLIQGAAHETLKYRRQINAEHIHIAADVLVKHAVPAGRTNITDIARDTADRGQADILIVTGEHTGGETALDDVRLVKQAVPQRPIWVGSGVNPDNGAAVRDAADGAIVGSWLHENGDLSAPLDVRRVKALVDLLSK